MTKYFTIKKGTFALYLILVPTMAFTSVWFTKSLQPLMDCVFEAGDKAFCVAACVAVVACIADMLAAGLHKTTREKLKAGFLAELRQDVFTSILKKDIPAYNGKGTAYYLNVLTKDIQGINESYFESVCGIYRVVASFVITFGALIWMNPTLAFFNVGISLISVFLPKLLEKRLVKAKNTASAASESFLQKSKDYLNGFTTVRLFHIREQIGQKFLVENVKQTKADCDSRVLNYWASWISMLCTTLCYVVTIIIGAWFVMQGKMTVGAILAISQLIGGIAVPFEELPIYITELNAIKDIKKKLLHLITTENTAETKENVIFEKCDIILQNISFSYNEEKKTLDEISYRFEAGKKYALIGESGSGKSTLAKVMMGFYPVQEGTIRLNGKEINSYSQGQLYHMLNYMQQDVFLFTDTLRNNLMLYQKYGEDRLQQVIKIAGLEEYVNNLENGLDTMLSEDGKNVSGGERQRIGLARTLLLGARYLILDETTSSLDAINEHQIEQSILQLNEVGCVFITHRLNPSLLEKCDEILLLKDGRIKEHGTFKTLMEKKEHFYSFYMVNH